ncbi:MAG: hypothetical protein ABJM43_07470 [Paracoccaceae bacterium]
MLDDIIEHDEWNHTVKKMPKAPKIKYPEIYGLLAFDGVRNPSARSSTSHRISMAYRTKANDWLPKIGMCESAAEFAVALEVLIHPDTYDLRFQSHTVKFVDEVGKNRSYTHDLLATDRKGKRRAIFVRNEKSLSKPKTRREIRAIIAATSLRIADEMIVVSASSYPRQRRENLFRMHAYVFDGDTEADDIVWGVASRLSSLWLVKDLYDHVPLPQWRILRSCYRLVARQKMVANLNHVLSENSRIEVAA